ncbi:MAG: metallophosphoesterase family protein [Candidatus Nanohaloarchaea archaeon]
MRLLLLTDIHGDTAKLEKILSREEFDGILCAGDLSDASEFEDYQSSLNEVLTLMEESSGLVKAVPGNMDPEEKCVRSLIDRKMNIHKKIASFEEFDVVGFGGGLTPFGTPFEPSGEDIRDSLEVLHGRMSSGLKAAVIHQPPKDTDLDIADGNHVGSEEVRELLENNDFDFLLTGHIHESFGTDEIGDTLMVNPGPVMEGHYGILEVEDDFEVELNTI